MNDAKYIGLDVHQATISVAVLDSSGALVMEAILETKPETILQFIRGLRGGLHVTFEEGTCAAWLHDLLKPHVKQVLTRSASAHYPAGRRRDTNQASQHNCPTTRDCQPTRGQGELNSTREGGWLMALRKDKVEIANSG